MIFNVALVIYDIHSLSLDICCLFIKVFWFYYRCCAIFLLAYIGVLYPYSRGSLCTSFIVAYALTFFFAGYSSSSFHNKLSASGWVSHQIQFYIPISLEEEIIIILHIIRSCFHTDIQVPLLPGKKRCFIRLVVPRTNSCNHVCPEHCSHTLWSHISASFWDHCATNLDIHFYWCPASSVGWGGRS